MGMPNIKKYTHEFLVGKTFNYLTYVKPSHKVGRAYYDIWKCECGKEIPLLTGEVVRGQRTSCGCRKHRKKELSVNWSGHKEISGSLWGSILSNARIRKIKVKLTIKEAWEKFLLQNRKCALTGVDLYFNSSYKTKDGNASLDRIDSTKSYTADNVQWVQKNINYIKRDFSDSEFIDLCNSVSKFNSSKS